MNDPIMALTTPTKKSRSYQEFTELVLTHGKFLHNFLTKKCWDKQDVDDIYQTVLMEAFRSFKNFRGDCHPRTWLCGVGMMVFRTHLRKSGRLKYQQLIENEEGYGDTLNSVELANNDDPESLHQFESLCSSIDGAVSGLPKKVREVFILVAYNGRNYENAAQELDIPIGTVRSRVSRARHMLRARSELHMYRQD